MATALTSGSTGTQEQPEHGAGGSTARGEGLGEYQRVWVGEFREGF